MDRFRLFSFVLLFSQCLMNPCFAQLELTNLMSTQDIVNTNSTSNISLHNNQNSDVTMYGLYISQLSYVTPGQSCNNATIIYPVTNNTTVGAFVMPTTIAANRSSAVGSNYLYNMIYSAIYYVNIIIPVSPPGCALPGCTWGSDTTKYNWCVYLGALAPVSTTSGYTANVPPAVSLASSAGVYNYNLISNPVYLGPITCNDGTLTCMTTNQQTQSF